MTVFIVQHYMSASRKIIIIIIIKTCPFCRFSVIEDNGVYCIFLKLQRDTISRHLLMSYHFLNSLSMFIDMAILMYMVLME